MALVQLGSRRADDEERHALGPVREVLEEGEHRLVGPVEVLEHEDGRAVLGEVLQEPTPGRELLLALGLRAGLDPEQRQQPLAEPGTLGALGQDAASSLPVATSTVSDSRIPAWAFTISPRAQNVMPSPYGRQRPWRQVTSPGRSSTYAPSSATIRLLPMPGSPTTVTSWTRLAATVLSKRPLRRARSISRPTYGLSCVRVRSTPRRARGERAWKTRTGSALPLSVAGGSSS